MKKDHKDQEDTDGVKRFSVVLPAKLFEKVRVYSFKNNIKIAESVRSLIKSGLEGCK